MNASPGTTVTFDIIAGHGTVPVIWYGTWPGINNPLPGRRLLALEWHARKETSYSAGGWGRRVDRLMERLRSIELNMY